MAALLRPGVLATQLHSDPQATRGRTRLKRYAPLPPLFPHTYNFGRAEGENSKQHVSACKSGGAGMAWCTCSSS
jgi:hypothetical protein